MVNMGTVWDRTTEFVSDNLTAIVPVALAAIFVPQSISGALGDVLSQQPALAPYLWLATCVLTLAVIWGQLVLTALALAPDAGITQARNAATRVFGWAVLISILIGLVVLLFAIPIPLILVMGGMKIEAMRTGMAGALQQVSGTAAMFVALYGLVLLVIGVMLFIRVTILAHPVLIAERLGLGAVRRSVALSRGLTLKLFGVFLLFSIVLVVAQLAVRSVFGFLFALLGSGGTGLSAGGVVIAILVGLFSTAYCVIVAVFQAKLYKAILLTSEERAVPA
jgi:hypothetical protein